MRTRDREIDSILRSHIAEAHVAPGATACVARRTDGGWRFALGAAGIRSELQPDAVAVDSYFDLASLTKPIFAVTLARLHDAGILSLDDPLGKRLPWLDGTFAGTATLEMLIAHRAGLKAHVDLFTPLVDGRTIDAGAALRAAADAVQEDLREQPFRGPYPPLYSDLGYLLVGRAVEESTGRALDEVMDEQLRALGIHGMGSARLLRARCSAFADQVVPSEVVAYRGGEIAGAVHDDNAWALSGLGCCGHAGSFGTAHEVARFGALMLDQLQSRSAVLSPATTARLMDERRDGTLRAGFDGKAEIGSSVGTRMGARTFGHLGFTGTSLWCDPAEDVVVVLLTNRVSPSRENVRIRAARPAVHDALFASSEAGSDGSARPGP